MTRICISGLCMRKYKKNAWNVVKNTQTFIISRDIKENIIWTFSKIVWNLEKKVSLIIICDIIICIICIIFIICFIYKNKCFEGKKWLWKLYLRITWNYFDLVLQLRRIKGLTSRWQKMISFPANDYRSLKHIPPAFQWYISCHDMKILILWHFWCTSSIMASEWSWAQKITDS